DRLRGALIDVEGEIRDQPAAGDDEREQLALDLRGVSLVQDQGADGAGRGAGGGDVHLKLILVPVGGFSGAGDLVALHVADDRAQVPRLRPAVRVDEGDALEVRNALHAAGGALDERAARGADVLALLPHPRAPAVSRLWRSDLTEAAAPGLDAPVAKLRGVG